MKVPILLRILLILYAVFHVWTIPLFFYPQFLTTAFSDATGMTNSSISVFSFPESGTSFVFAVRIVCGLLFSAGFTNALSAIQTKLHVDSFRTLLNVNILSSFLLFVSFIWGIIEETVEFGYNNPNGTPIIVFAFLIKYAVFNILFWIFRIRLSFRRKKEQRFEDVKFPDEELENQEISNRKKKEIVKSYRMETAFVDDEDML